MDQHQFAYVFEAKSIQRYVLDSAKLRDMVGASELIESLWGEVLDNVVEQIERVSVGKVEFSRCNGGAFAALLSNKSTAEYFRDLWSLTVQQYAPGLEFVHAIGESDNSTYHAIANANEQIRSSRNFQRMQLPLAGPLVARYPRTGAPATKTVKRKKDQEEQLDLNTSRKRSMVRNQKNKPSKLIRSFSFETQPPLRWPTDLNPEDSEEENNDDQLLFPFVSNNHYIGIIHADGNGLGQLLMGMKPLLAHLSNAQYIDIFREFSDAIEKATREAAKEASKEVLRPNKNGVMPARPIVLAGDDLNIIVRGDLAINFAQKFIETFEQTSANAFTHIKNELKKSLGKAASNKINNFPTKLTACAGIAFINAKQPFYLGYELAEGLCKYAKSKSKSNLSESGEIPSSLAFHRVTTSIIDDYDEIIANELSAYHDSKCYLASMQPYSVGKVETILPKLANLEKLKKSLSEPEMSRGPTRQLLGLLELNPDQAEKIYQRWQENLSKLQSSSADEKSPSDTFKQLMKNIMGQAPERTLPFLSVTKKNSNQERLISPLGDIAAWQAIEGTDNE